MLKGVKFPRGWLDAVREANGDSWDINSMIANWEGDVPADKAVDSLLKRAEALGVQLDAGAWPEAKDKGKKGAPKGAGKGTKGNGKGPGGGKGGGFAGVQKGPTIVLESLDAEFVNTETR